MLFASCSVTMAERGRILFIRCGAVSRFYRRVFIPPAEGPSAKGHSPKGAPRQ
jgi:hypothetical protein